VIVQICLVIKKLNLNQIQFSAHP